MGFWGPPPLLGLVLKNRLVWLGLILLAWSSGMRVWRILSIVQSAIYRPAVLTDILSLFLYAPCLKLDSWFIQRRTMSKQASTMTFQRYTGAVYCYYRCGIPFIPVQYTIRTGAILAGLTCSLLHKKGAGVKSYRNAAKSSSSNISDILLFRTRI